MPRPSKKLREKIRHLADDRCEYCQTAQAMTMAAFHVDHIVPRSANGKTEFENLCLSCPFCNQFKGQQTFALDPKTKKKVRLFHPRIDEWSKHFQWDQEGIKIVGKTARGRATVNALNLNHPSALKARSFWVACRIHPPEQTQ